METVTMRQNGLYTTAERENDLQKTQQSIEDRFAGDESEWDHTPAEVEKTCLNCDNATATYSRDYCQACWEQVAEAVDLTPSIAKLRIDDPAEYL